MATREAEREMVTFGFLIYGLGNVSLRVVYESNRTTVNDSDPTCLLSCLNELTH